MHKTGSPKIIANLDRVKDSRSCGSKALTVARLARKGFQVPEGFCLSTDAYRTHLWSAGIRQIARGLPGPEERASLRQAILENNLPSDVSSALEEAYKSLGEDTELIVRHSASDENIAGKAYITVSGVRGLAELTDAVKQVWASLWSDEAAELREDYQEKQQTKTEPSMAVLIQKMVQPKASGIAITADNASGNPHLVQIRSSWGIYTPSSADKATVDLLNFHITEASIANKEKIAHITHDGVESEPTPSEMVQAPSLSPAQIIQLSEAAIWVDMCLDGPQVVQWANDGDRFLILGAKPTGKLRPYYPCNWRDKREGLLVWQILHPEPSPGLMQSLPVFDEMHIPSLPSAGKGTAIRGHNLRVYRRVIHPWESTGRIAAFRDVWAAGRLHNVWRSAVDRIAKGCWRNLARPVQKLPNRELMKTINSAFDKVDESAWWLEAVLYPSKRLPHLLKEMLAAKGQASLFPRLFMGQDPAWLEKDRAFQRLATYVWQAKEEPELADVPLKLAWEISKRLGGAFSQPSDVYDISSWQSWVEDPDRVLEIAEALVRGPLHDVDLAQRNAAIAAKVAEKAALLSVSAATGFLNRPFTQLKFRILLHRARTAAAAVSASEQVHALALATLRLSLLELGRRLEEAKTITKSADVFYLKADEVRKIRLDMDEESVHTLRRTIAQRKHEAWLAGRLVPPHWLPLGAGPHLPEAPSEIGRILNGKPAGLGEVVGTARVAKSLAEALNIEPGEILVVEDMGPEWTPLLGLAAGLVMERGDMFSRGAAAARNYGIPCVFDVRGLMSVVQTGQTIRIDGSSGTVEIVKR